MPGVHSILGIICVKAEVQFVEYFEKMKLSVLIGRTFFRGVNGSESVFDHFLVKFSF